MPDYIITLMSCVVSYVLLSATSLIRVGISFLSYLPDNALIESGISIFIGTILAVVAACVFSSKWFSEITLRLFHKTANDCIWRDVLDFENGSNLKIYLKNEDYYVIGHHKFIEENGDDSWIAVSAFGKFNKNSNLNYKSEPLYLDDENVIYTIRLSDIEHIEIF